MTNRRSVGLGLAAVLAASGLACGAAQAQIGAYPPIETAITLPKDEASHRQPAEWWYVTGHLDGVDPSGAVRKYGIEMVVFQVVAIAGLPPTYSSHFAISDLNRGKFAFEERVLAAPFPILPNRIDLNVLGFQLGGTMGQYYVKAAHGNGAYAVDLTFKNKVPVTLNGVNGIEQFGAFVSPYYSFTAMDTKGTLIDHGVPIKITGVSWYDHEWANSAPGNDKGGWTWFGVGMADNTQYNLSFLQDASGAVVKAIGVKTANGTYAPIPESQLQLQSIGAWTSPHTGYTYPQRWRITLPGGVVDVTPKIQDQELYAPGHRYYYEGPATVTGTLNGVAATGNAYAEVNPHNVDFGISLP